MRIPGHSLPGTDMSVGQGSVRRVELTDGQRRTLHELIGTGERDEGVPPGSADRVRSRLDGALGALTIAEPLWLSKGRLDELARCQGMLDASLRGERDAFSHS